MKEIIPHVEIKKEDKVDKFGEIYQDVSYRQKPTKISLPDPDWYEKFLKNPVVPVMRHFRSNKTSMTFWLMVLPFYVVMILGSAATLFKQIKLIFK